MSRARSTVLLLLVLPLVACGKNASPARPPEPSAKIAAPETKPAPEKSTANAGGSAPIALPKATSGVLAAGVADKVLAIGAPAIVRLLDPGAEPRADLSYAIAQGPAPKLGMAMEKTTVFVKVLGEAELPRMAFPRIGMTLDGSATAPNAAGEWKILASFVGFTVEGKGSKTEMMSDAMMAEVMRPQFEAMKGLGINCWLSPKGRVRDVKVELPKGFPAAAEAQVQWLSQSFESFVAPLPNEAVGVGAKWQVVSRTAASGADVLQAATYTLRAREGAKATLDVTTTQLLASDTIHAPGSPATAVMHVKSISSESTGTTRIDTTSVVPESGTTTVKTAMTVVYSGAAPGESSSIETRTMTLFRP